MRTLTAGPTMAPRAAGQTATPTVVTDVAPPAPSAPASPIQYDASGHLVGIDGVLRQITGALADTLEPMLRTQVYPMIQRDKALQREVGGAAGDALGRRLRGPAWVVALSLATIAGVMVYNARTRR